MSSNACDNIILITDSYKVTHYKQYPPKTTKLYSYFESRGGKFESTVFFGLQYIIKRWLQGSVVSAEKIEEAKQFYLKHFNQNVFNEKGWTHILNKHNGVLPLRIKAVAEGSVIPTHNVLFTVENTDPEVPWLTNWLETLLLQCWYPITVASLSRAQKKLLATYLYETADTMDALKFQLHDFGFRGVSSVEQASIGGAAHLVNFLGTDTIAGIQLISKFYSCEMAGFSVPASEHSTMTTWAALANSNSNDHLDGETAACQHMITAFPTGVISVVSDSYNIYECCEKIWCDRLRDAVIKRGKTDGNVIVIRPDSGDPNVVLPQIFNILEKSFKDDCLTNSKGYKVLPKYLRIIQGDGISHESLSEILGVIKNSGWSTENLVFGSGGSLLQRLNRDTQKCAFKCSYALIDGKAINVYKNPITDKEKMSKKGILSLQLENGKYVTYEEQQDPTKRVDGKDLLETVFENGVLLKEYSFDEVRENAKLEINGIRI